MTAPLNKEDYIPTEAYLFFPTEKEMKNEAGVRLFFDGNMRFDATEHKQIATFKAYCDKHKYTLPSMWDDNLLLRFLYANGFKNDKMLNAVKEHTAWREQKLPAVLNADVQKFLDKGYLYIHGRDHKFRPIIIFRAYLLESKNFDVDKMIDGLTYFFEYVIENFLLPGQVENWVFITDLNGMGMSSLPYGPLKKLLGFLQNNYRGRLAVMYIVNTPTFIAIPWKMAKAFLEESTVKKINFMKKQIPEPIFKLAHSSQVEQKYGGKAPNLTSFWPPIIPSTEYYVNPEDSACLISIDEYKVRYNSGKLENLKLNSNLTSPVQSPVKSIDKSLSKDFAFSPVKDVLNLNVSKSEPPHGNFYSHRETSTKMESSPIVRSKSQEIIIEEFDYDETMEEKCYIYVKEQRILKFKQYFRKDWIC